jgi:hypothetical protein
VHRDEIGLLVEDGLDDVVGILVGHFRVRHEMFHTTVFLLSVVCPG